VTTQCSQIAATLKLSGTTAFDLGPSQQYATSLGHIFSTLQSAAATGASHLQSATTAAAQATAAGQIAAAYNSAASSLRRLSLSPAVRELNASLASSLAAVARDYSALGSAAAAGDEGAYARASSAIGSDRKHAESAVAALSGAGYVVSG
jgi:hypothetical protein